MWERSLVDCVTHWTTGTDGFGGQEFGEPRYLKGRWQDSQEKFSRINGQETISRAVVYLDCDVAIGDFVMLGEQVGNPIQLGALEVQAFNRTHDLRRMQVIRKAML